jgi:hypothetical protein
MMMAEAKLSSERAYLAEQFEEHRTHLRAVAYRMLGSMSEGQRRKQQYHPEELHSRGSAVPQWKGRVEDVSLRDSWRCGRPA